MKMKRFAVRGLIAVAAAVALCVFFAGTIRGVVTAKVKIVQPRAGKMTQTVELRGELRFPVEEEVRLESDLDVQITVKTVKVQPGSAVEADDVVLTAVVADYERMMREYRESYAEAQNSLRALEDKDIRLKRTDEAWAAAWEALSAAQDAYLDCDLAFRARLRMENLELGEDGSLPEGANEELEELYAARADAAQALAAAQADMDSAERYSVSEEVRAYLTDRVKYARQMEKTEKEMLELTVLGEQVKSVRAGQDGYVTKLNAKEGDTVSLSGALFSVCPEDEMPTLRLDVTDSPVAIAKGMDAVIAGVSGSAESEICDTGVLLDGGRYADVKLKKGIVKDLGGMEALQTGGADVKVEYKAKQATTLLPSAAVRGSGDERYVYVLRREESAFGTKKDVVAKQDVTVLAESGGTASVEEDLSYLSVVYMEDRVIDEGDAVMEYEE